MTSTPETGSEPTPSTASAAPPQARKSPWRRRLLIIGACMLLIIAFVAALPTIVSATFLQGQVTKQLAQALGTDVSIDECSFGWLSGVEIAGLTVQQPEGFPSDRPAIALRSANVTIGLWNLVGGRIDVAGEVIGLEVVVHQLADGTVSLAKLGGPDRGSGRGDEVQVDAEASKGRFLTRLRTNLAIRDVRIDVYQADRGRLESIQALKATLDKRFGGTDFDLDLSARLAGPDDTQEPGTIGITANVDGTFERPLEARLTTAGLDFARYRPLLDAFLDEGALTALGGVLNGSVTARVAGLRFEPTLQIGEIDVDGALVLARPRFAGALLQGMTVNAEKWTINPKLKVTEFGGGGQPKVDVGSFNADFGFASLSGIPAEKTAQILAGESALALDFRVDLQQVGQLGGPVPALLAEQPANVHGTVAIAMPAAGLQLDDLVKLITDCVHLDATVEVPQLTLDSGTSFAGVSLNATLAGGEASAKLAQGASLNGGGMRLTAAADLSKPDWPTQLSVGVDGAQLAGQSVKLLQYAVPLLAGLADQPSVQFQSTGTLTLEVSGHATKKAEQTWIQWLGNWTGNGHVGLGEGSLRPAPALASLLQWADPDNSGVLKYDGLETDFSISRGSIETKVLQLQQKAGKLGLTGRTTFTGEIDHRIDLTQLLVAHKDGQKVLKYLGEKKVEAQLAGTLSTPQLGAPDLQQLLTQALKNAATDEVQKAADKLLKKGLDQLFRKK